MSKPDCSRHTDSISHFGKDFKTLAEEIGDLKYDALHDFLNELEQKIRKDAVKDSKGKRHQLADALSATADSLDSAAESIDEAWKISKPFMKK